MYAMVCIRPNLTYTIGILGRYSQNPGDAHYRAEKMLRYLKGTSNYMLTYRCGDDFQVIGADIAGCKDTMKSTFICVFLLGGGVVS